MDCAPRTIRVVQSRYRNGPRMGAFLLLVCIIGPLMVLYTLRKRCGKRRHCLRNRTVLITGCDSGFGYSLALWCHEQGMEVLAACLHQDGEGGRALKEEGIQTTQLDLTNVDNIEAMEGIVAKHFGPRGR